MKYFSSHYKRIRILSILYDVLCNISYVYFIYTHTYVHMSHVRMFEDQFSKEGPKMMLDMR